LTILDFSIFLHPRLSASISGCKAFSAFQKSLPLAAGIGILEPIFSAVRSLYTGRDDLVQRRLYFVWLLSLFFVTGFSNARAALIEHNLVVEPNFVHGNERNSISSTSSRLEIALPDITLAPGDVLRVTVELAGGKYLKLGPTPVDGQQYFGAGLGMQSGALSGVNGDGVGVDNSVQIFDSNSQLLFEEVQPASYFFNEPSLQVRWLAANLTRELQYGEPTDLTFRKWSFEFEMPTEITTRNGTFPYQTTTFTSNELGISFDLYRFGYFDMPEVAVYVVPEPGTLSLLGALAIAAVCFRRS
jgi:hypothetical protein